MLHIFAKSPIESHYLDRISAGDSVLFIRSAVCDLLSGGTLSKQLSVLQTQTNLAVLSSDLQARGILPGELVDGITIIDYPGFVELTIKHSVIQSW